MPLSLGSDIIARLFGEPNIFSSKSTSSDILHENVPNGTVVQVFNADGELADPSDLEQVIQDEWVEVRIPSINAPNVTQPLRGFVESIFIVPEPIEAIGFEMETPAVIRPMSGLLQNILHFKGHFANPQPDSKFGPITKLAVEDFQRAQGLPINGRIDQATGEKLGLSNWMDKKSVSLVEPFYERSSNSAPSRKEFEFKAVIESRFFSHWPNSGRDRRDPLTLRTIRCNNPGAINRASWRRKIPGYVGVTRPDNSEDGNQTMIFTSPEFGVAAWRFWFTKVMFPGVRRTSIADIVKKYAGNPAKEEAYFVGYLNFSPPDRPMTRDVIIDLQNDDDMRVLAQLQFSHETGFRYPLTDAQFAEGVRIAGALLEQERNSIAGRVMSSVRSVMRFVGLGG